MRRLLLVITLLGCTAASAATVYKWVDAEGVVHYSDQPHPGAQQLETGTAPEPQPAARPAAGAPAPQTAASGTRAAPQASARRAYSICQIAQPAHEQVLQNAFSLEVRVRLVPELRPGDRLVLTLDGARHVADHSTHTISPVHRGTHSLTASVENESGQTLCQTAPVSFHVHQPSVLAPANRRPRS